jgi:hypothetical protein
MERSERAIGSIRRTICELHQNAQTLLDQRIHLVSTDEMTGIQAKDKIIS